MRPHSPSQSRLPAGILAVVVAVAMGDALTAAEPAPRPNVVFILVDDIGYADCGFMGATDTRTPSIDALAAAGTILEAHYAQAFCSPTRACLLTGRYPTRTGCYRIFMTPAEGGLPPGEITLADALKASGYQTAICGKWHLGQFAPKYLPQARGFDRQYGHYGSAINYFTHEAGRQRDWFRDGQPLDEDGYATDLIAAESCRLIATRDAAKPLFLLVSFNAVHAPAHARPDQVAMFKGLTGPRRVHAAMLWSLDEGIGRITRALDEAGIRDDTLVVFAGDNGGMWPGVNGPLRDLKGTLYEGGIRACAFATWPNRIPAGRRTAEPMHVVDWFPTLVKLAGGTPDPARPLDGRDVWPMIAEGRPSPHEEILVARAPDDGAIRAGNWKLTHGKRSKKLELYDLASDLGETKDLAEAEPAKLAELQTRLAAALRGAVPVYAEPAANAVEAAP